MLASLASDRYQSAQELAEDLELWLTFLRRPDFQLGPDETKLAAPPRQLQSRGLRPFKRKMRRRISNLCLVRAMLLECRS